MVRKIEAEVSEGVLQADLDRYCRRALELGAADAKIITADMVLIDERVRAKCYVPSCGSLGKNAHCPPHAMDLDFMRRVVCNFRYGIFFMIKVPSKELAGPAVKEKKSAGRSAMLNWTISAKIESEAFYDGYHLAMAFTGGPCEPYLCPGSGCGVLSGEGCRRPYVARPSMEAVGMNAFRMAAKVGWEIYPIGGSVSPAEVPHGVRLGLVLIY